MLNGLREPEEESRMFASVESLSFIPVSILNNG